MPQYVYVWRLREIADERGLDYLSIAQMLKNADPDGQGIAKSNVSRHLNKNEWANMQARTLWLYCKALDVSFHELVVDVRQVE